MFEGGGIGAVKLAHMVVIPVLYLGFLLKACMTYNMTGCAIVHTKDSAFTTAECEVTRSSSSAAMTMMYSLLTDGYAEIIYSLENYCMGEADHGEYRMAKKVQCTRIKQEHTC